MSSPLGVAHPGAAVELPQRSPQSLTPIDRADDLVLCTKAAAPHATVGGSFSSVATVAKIWEGSLVNPLPVTPNRKVQCDTTRPFGPRREWILPLQTPLSSPDSRSGWREIDLITTPPCDTPLTSSDEPTERKTPQVYYLERKERHRIEKNSLPRIAIPRNFTANAPLTISECFTLLCAVAAQQSVRPLSDFIKVPSIPTYEAYVLRLWVNFLYYARNYVNLLMSLLLLWCLRYPQLLSLLGLAVATHKLSGQQAIKARSGLLSVGDALRLTQLVACALSLYHVGLGMGFLFATSLSLPVVGHALFTPYSDNAYTAYQRALEAQGYKPIAPRSPTNWLDKMDDMFVDVLSTTRKGTTRISG